MLKIPLVRQPAACKSSTEAPVSWESSAEAIVCIFCHQSFTTQENLRYHGRYCQSNPLVDPNSGLFNGLGVGVWHGLSCTTSNIGQPGRRILHHHKAPLIPRKAWTRIRTPTRLSRRRKMDRRRRPDSLRVTAERAKLDRDFQSSSRPVSQELSSPISRRSIAATPFLKSSIPSYEAESPSGELPPNFHPPRTMSWNHTLILKSLTTATPILGETSSFLNAISTPQGDYLISPEQLLSAASDGCPSDSTVEEVRGIITDLRGVANNITDVQVDQKIRVRDTRSFNRIYVPLLTKIWTASSCQNTSFGPVSGSKHRQF